MVDELPSIPTDLAPAIFEQLATSPMQVPAPRCRDRALRSFQCPRTRLEHSAEIPAPPLPLWREVAAGAQVSIGGTHAVPLGDCTQGARASRRSRGSRGRGSQTRHREARSAARAAQSGQRDADNRSGPQSANSEILAAIQQQGQAIQALAQSVVQMTKAVSSFLFADRRAKGSSEGARHRGTGRADEELRFKAEGEWERLERLAGEKITEIVSMRIAQAPDQTHSKILDQFRFGGGIIDREIQEAIVKMRTYEKCPHRRTSCKALEQLVHKYNSSEPVKVLKNPGAFNGGIWVEPSPSFKMFKFTHLGEPYEQKPVWVDPGRFQSYDLLRSENYSERPL